MCNFCSEHWSLAIYDLRESASYYANSVGGYHGDIRMYVERYSLFSSFFFSFKWLTWNLFLSIVQKVFHYIELIIPKTNLVSHI